MADWLAVFRRRLSTAFNRRNAGFGGMTARRRWHQTNRQTSALPPAPRPPPQHPPHADSPEAHTGTMLRLDPLALCEPCMRPFRFPWLWRGIGWLMLATVTYLLVTPRLPEPLDIAHADKLYHVAGFALLSGWAALLFESHRALLLRGLMLVAFGAAMEGVQALLPWRSADLLDFAANLGGVALGLLVGFTPLARSLWLIERRVFGPQASADN
jgi:VanZ family protein